MTGEEPTQPDSSSEPTGQSPVPPYRGEDAADESESEAKPDTELEAIQKLRKSADQLVQEITRLKAQADSSTSDVQSAKGKVETLRQIIEELKDKLEQAVANVSESQNKIIEASSAIMRLKQPAEADAKAIQATREQVDANARDIQTQKGAADTNATSIQQLLAEVKGASKSLAEYKQNADDARAEAEKSRDTAAEHLEAARKAKEEIEQVHGQLTGWRNTSKDNFKAITGSKTQTEALLAEVQQLKDQAVAALADTTSSKEAAAATASQVTTLHQQVQALEAETQSLKKGIEGYSKATQGLADRSKDVETSLNEYEGKLTTLETTYEEKFKDLTTRIESLFSGATGVGLAKAFGNRKATFDGPKKYWLIAFAVTLALLVGAAITEFAVSANNGTIPKTWEDFLLHLLIRLPIALPLIWFALYTARQATIARRLEEDYAYKESISMAFEGYKREMRDISKDGDPNNPVIKLSAAVIDTLGASPDRIYDKKGLHGSPLTHAADAFNDSQEAIRAAAGAPPVRRPPGKG